MLIIGFFSLLSYKSGVMEACEAKGSFFVISSKSLNPLLVVMSPEVS